MSTPTLPSRLLLLGATAFLLSLTVTSGCSKPPPVSTPDIGEPVVDADAGSDGGTGTADVGVDAGPPPCRIDDDCPQGQRCEDASRKCIPAKECQDDPSTCNADDTYCDNTVGLGCRCVIAKAAPLPTTPGTNGFCKRRNPACTPCKTDEECGNDANFFKTALHNEGRCVTMEDGKKYCLERFGGSSTCACGTAATYAGASYCAPQDKSCAAGTFLCCQADTDCPSNHPLCDVASQLCKDSCTYAFDTEQTVGCRVDQVCNVDPTFLTAKAVNYGAGRCAPPCKGDAECQALRSDFICKAELKTGGGKASEPRCRPAGCLSDFECPETPVTSPYKGYCDRSDGKCKATSCRNGTDPLTGAALKDCKGGFACDPSGVCKEQGCVEQGGADNACGFDEFCCGEDRNGNKNLTDDPCTNDVGISLAAPGKCYKAPRPPFCKTCAANTDCKGGGAPVSVKDPAQCLDFGQGAGCIYGCTLSTQCPRGYSCSEIPVDCSKDAMVCGVATRCFDTGQKDMNMNPIKHCRCTAAGAPNGECPTGNRCNNAGTTCIIIQGCIPGGRIMCP